MTNIPIVVIAISTVINSCFIFFSYKETAKIRKSQTDPRIVVRIDKDTLYNNSRQLIIANEGKGIAKNIKFEFDGDDSYLASSIYPPTAIKNLEIIEQGVNEMSPGNHFKYLLETANPEEFEDISGKQWKFKVLYSAWPKNTQIADIK